MQKRGNYIANLTSAVERSIVMIFGSFGRTNNSAVGFFMSRGQGRRASSPSVMKQWTLKLKKLALRPLPSKPVGLLTSQVLQRPQQASVVIRSPLQPGFLARKVNSLTAQPTKVCRLPLEVLRAESRPPRRRRVMAPRTRYASFMLFPRRERKQNWTYPSARHGAVHNVLVTPRETLLLALQENKMSQGTVHSNSISLTSSSR